MGVHSRVNTVWWVRLPAPGRRGDEPHGDQHSIPDHLHGGTDDSAVVYDVRGPLPPTGGELPLFMFSQPVDASGFGTLAGLFGDRTVITYDHEAG